MTGFGLFLMQAPPGQWLEAINEGVDGTDRQGGRSSSARPGALTGRFERVSASMKVALIRFSREETRERKVEEVGAK